MDVIPPKVSTSNSEDVTSPSITWDKVEESDRPAQERSSLALAQTQVFDSEKGGFFYVDELDVSNLEEAIDTEDDNSTSETNLIDWS